MGPINTLHCW